MLLATLITLALAWAVGALVLMIVSRLGLGLTVDGFGPAFIASAVISIVSAAIVWLLGLIGVSLASPGLLTALVALVVSAIVLLISARFVRGMKVNGFAGAIVAAIAYGVVVWLLQWLIGLFV